jgi:drug/metabolite transporter (DMT)-like permease
MAKTDLNHHTKLPSGRDALLLAIGVLGIGTSGPLIARSTMPVSTLAFWRNLIGALLISPFAIRRGDWRERSKAPQLALSALAGMVLAIHFYLFFLAMRDTGVAAGTALAATQPIFAALYLRARGHQINNKSMAGIALAFASVLVITGVDFGHSHSAFFGDLAGIGCAAFAAVYVMIGAKVQEAIATSTYTCICYASCAFSSLLISAVSGVKIWGFPSIEWRWVLLLVLGAQLMGHTMFNAALGSVSPAVVSLIVFFEVPVAGVIAWFWLGQHITQSLWIGIVGILIGCAIFVSGGNSSRAEINEN